MRFAVLFLITMLQSQRPSHGAPLTQLASKLLHEPDVNTWFNVTVVYRQVLERAPQKKQIMALSATYSPESLVALEALMTQPQHVMLCQSTVALLGIRQYFQEIPCDNGSGGRCSILPPAGAQALSTFQDPLCHDVMLELCGLLLVVQRIELRCREGIGVNMQVMVMTPWLQQR